jgi:two-component sensor histidine kinase/Tfp pilus assembly protein PilF
MASISLIRKFFLWIFISLFSIPVVNAQTESAFKKKISELKLLHITGEDEKALKMLEGYAQTAPDQYQGRLLFIKGAILFSLKQPDSAIASYNRAFSFGERVANKKLQFEALVNLGAIHSRQGELRQASYEYKKALELLETSGNDTLLGIVNFNLALAYKEIGLNDKAIERAFTASQLFIKLNDQEYLAKCYQTLGNIYREVGKYTESIFYHKKGLKFYEEQENLRAQASVLNDLGNTYKELYDFDNALKFYEKSMLLADSLFKPITIGNMAEVYEDLGNYKKAETYYLRAIKLRDQKGDTKAFAYSITELGGLYISLEQYDKAKIYLKEATKIAAKKEYTDILERTFTLRNRLYEKQGNADTAYFYLKALIDLKDEVYNRNSQDIIEGKTVEFGVQDLEEKNAELVERSQLNALLAQRERKEKYVYLALALLFLSALGIATYAFIQSRKNARLQEELRLLEKARKSEVEHRTKNFLQTLVSLFKFQLSSIHDPSALAAIQQARNRLDAMVSIHRILENSEEKVINFSDYVKQLVDQIKKTFEDKAPDVYVNFDLENIMLDSDEITPLGLSINEIVTNAFKYGLAKHKTPRLEISMKKAGEMIYLTIADNGPGISESPMQKAKGKGLGLVKIFIEQQLDGSIKFANHMGTKIEIKVRIKPVA